MSIVIFQLHPSDWRDYKTIQLEALQEDPQAFASQHDEWLHASDEKWQERPSNPDTVIFVAKDGDKLVGLVGLHRESKTKAELWGMYVNKSYRGRGIASKLIEKIFVLGKGLSLQKIGLMVNPEQTSAVQLYQFCGFQQIGTQQHILGDGEEHPVLVMEKSLG